MDRGAWWATVHKVAESDITEHINILFVVQSLSQVRLCDPVDCSVPGFPVPHHLLEFAQTHVHELQRVVHD